MKPFNELITMPDKRLPLYIFPYSSKEENVYVHPHWHGEMEILYIVKGKVTIQVNEQIFAATPGDIVLISSDAVHSTNTEKNIENTLIVFQINIDLIDAYSTDPWDKKYLDLLKQGINFPAPIKSTCGAGAKIQDILFKLRREYEEKDYAYEMITKSYIYELVGIFARNFHMFRKEPVSGAELSITKSMLLKTFRYIDENFSENLSLRQAAQVSNLSVSHFCRLFKQATGMTFNHYLSFYRVNRSESMLTSNQSITEIAYECGFKNLISFIRVFKKLKGCPPSEYRKNILKTIQSVENKQKIPDKLQ